MFPPESAVCVARTTKRLTMPVERRFFGLTLLTTATVKVSPAFNVSPEVQPSLTIETSPSTEAPLTRGVPVKVPAVWFQIF